MTAPNGGKPDRILLGSRHLFKPGRDDLRVSDGRTHLGEIQPTQSPAKWGGGGLSFFVGVVLYVNMGIKIGIGLPKWRVPFKQT